MSKIKVNEIEKASGSGITVPTGTSFTITDGLAIGSVPTITQAKIDNEAINEAKLQVSNAPTNGYFLSAQSGNTGGLTWAEAGGGGKVLQIVQGSLSSTMSSSANSMTDTGLSVAITPSATSSKVLVFVMHPFVRKSGDNSAKIGIVRGSTQIAAMGNFDTGDSQQITDTVTGMFLDTPNTTSATTYKTQLESGNGYIYAASASSIIICMEIGA